MIVEDKRIIFLLRFLRCLSPLSFILTINVYLYIAIYLRLLRVLLLEHMAIGLRVRVHLAGLRVNALMRIIYARVPPG